MGRRSASLLLLLLVVGRPVVARAGDVYTFFDAECRRTTGVLVHVDEETVAMVDLQGRFVGQPRADIHSAVLHQPLENPLSVIQVDAAFVDYLREVWVGEDEHPSFVGWATGFYDDLLIFLDLEGKTHVIEPGEVKALHRADVTPGQQRPRVYAPARLGYPPEIVPCSRAAPGPDDLPPSRVIADRIKLGDYFAKLEEHYRSLSDFEERTRVYATPFVFDEASRVGLIYFQHMDLPFPFYFRWSSGRPYRFQSETVVGNAPHHELPFMEPTLSVSSDLKSHFFNAAFVGNFLALPAGGDPFLLSELLEQMPTSTLVDVSYNYLILMGADYWRLSASAGPAYLATRILVPPQGGRDVRAQRATLAARLRYHSPGLSARVMYFRTRMSGPLTDLTDDAPPEATYANRMDAVRLGATIAVYQGVQLDADEIVTFGKHVDAMIPTPVSIEWVHAETAAVLSADFGRYVTVKGYARLIMRRYDVSAPIVDEDTRWDRIFGGGLEFVF